MPASDSTPFFRWQTLSARTTTVLLQAVLWVLLCGFYFAWYNRTNYRFGGPIWSLVLLRLTFAVVLFNALVYLIIPRWLLRGRFWLAALGGVLLIYGYGLFNFCGYHLAETYLQPPARLAQYYHEMNQPGLRKAVFSWQGLLEMTLEMQANMMFPLVISFLTYAQVVDRRRLALERDQLNLELRYLKTQINPQFLFNTLGSLHGFTRHRDPRAGDMVLHLADLMRYTLYESDTETVLLSRELEFLDDYLALERLHGRELVRISYTATGTVSTQRIVPLVLYPFLERLFAGLDAASVADITTTLHTTEHAITATFTRSSPTPPAVAYSTDGAVLAALRRLQLQYPSRHQAKLTEEATSLRLELHLDL
ncbi:Histidine kinase [Hymenobacter gelipurpurascens]|uniref:Histidine kinase n=1 Tax=Hymenobacter gelipurpurascens TaxID=89968 RepID=A0A212TDQ4_9BACT|nr:histidine kinase [Hymenobacter gelipurpurascens]SNC63980.1 Histidine kinase [Hymenobacter gelipurpurascens]